MRNSVDSSCDAFQRAIRLLSQPWTGLILTLLQDGPLRFSEIADRAPGLGDKVLAIRLKHLEAKGLISRHVEPGPPVRVRYELCPAGRAFGHVAEAIERWGRALGTAPAKPSANPARPRARRVARSRA